ncbi:MAG: heme transporter [Burkholderiales bacterium]|jgi:heme exporter protein B|nr:heme transporter [Burkholderiales bacterium]
MSPVLALVRRDLRLALRTPGDSATVVLFFVLACVLFPLGVGPEPNILARIATGVIWVMALLASLLSLDRLFQLDAEDGSLDLIALSPAPLEFLVLGKCVAHWLATGLPLVIVSPLLGLFLNLPDEAYPVLLLALALGTPTLSLIGGVGAALTLGARRGGVLLALLILPLYIPVLIFGVAAVEAAVAGLTPRPHLLLLGGMLALSLPLAPFAGAAAIRQALE